MKRKGILIGIGLAIVGSLINLSALAADSTEVAKKKVDAPSSFTADIGRSYFEGSKSFMNGGPACITCHNVNDDKLIPGGMLAKDLTDVYDRMGEGITAWLGAPPFPAMIASYQNHELTEIERSNLTAYLKEANEKKGSDKSAEALNLFVMGGVGGLIGILIIISLLWMKRKRQMVKKDIFKRQNRAWDAKH